MRPGGLADHPAKVNPTLSEEERESLQLPPSLRKGSKASIRRVPVLLGMTCFGVLVTVIDQSSPWEAGFAQTQLVASQHSSQP